MTKSELIKKMMNVDKSIDLIQAQAIIDIIINSIIDTVKYDGRAEFRKFGVFSSCERKQYETTNPVTQRRMLLKKQKLMRFKAGSVLNKRINTYKEVMK